MIKVEETDADKEEDMERTVWREWGREGGTKWRMGIMKLTDISMSLSEYGPVAPDLPGDS